MGRFGLNFAGVIVTKRSLAAFFVFFIYEAIKVVYINLIRRTCKRPLNTVAILFFCNIAVEAVRLVINGCCITPSIDFRIFIVDSYFDNVNRAILAINWM